MQKILLITTLITCVPFAASSEENVLKYKIPSVVKNIAQGVEAGKGLNTLKSELTGYALGFVDTNINAAEQSILDTTNFTYFDITLGSDAFGLDGGDVSTKVELMAVYRLYEDKNKFVFNQASVVNFDGRNTLNFGLGARFITDDETIITGVNAFFDHELDSNHQRVGAGFELLTSMLEFRANKYNAITGTINYNGIDETALDGHDFKLTANLPYFYSSNIHFTSSEWKDGAGYKTETEQLGVSAEVLPNLVVDVSRQKKDNTASDTVASISYSIQLGTTPRVAKKVQDGKWSTKMKPIREKLYQPVQRENRIVKKSVKLGLTVSGA